MSFLAQCSFCGHQVKARDGALGASVRCPRCDNHFTAAPREEPAPAEALARFRLSKAAAVVTAPPPPAADARTSDPNSPDSSAAPVAAADRALAQGMALPANPTLAAMGTTGEEAAAEVAEPPAPETDLATTRAFGGRIHLVGLAALLLTGAGLVCAAIEGLSWLTIPLAALGLLTALVAVAVCLSGSRPALLFPIGASLLSAALLVIGWFFPWLLGPVYEGARGAPARDKSAVAVIPLSLEITDPAELTISGWVDASRAVVQQDQVRVQLAGARIVPLKLGPTEADYLLIRLRIQHVGAAREIPYLHWERTAGPGKSPRLTDDKRQTLPLAPWKDDRPPVHEQLVKEKPLYPGMVIDDALVFTAPAAGVKFLQLELPAAAWGGAGVVRFHLPASMIKIKKVAETEKS
jgi:hypothetical protein